MAALEFFFALVLTSACLAQAQTTNADFHQAVVDYQRATDRAASWAAAEKVIKLASAMDQLPSISEEARKHFVMGTTLLEDAKTPNDYTQVGSEFSQATRIAPWWPEARLKRGMAYEAAGKYADAIEQLKLFQLFKLPDSDARKVQDEIYVLEAKQEKAAKDAQFAEQKQAEEARAKAEADAAARQKQLENERNRFVGTWKEFPQAGAFSGPGDYGFVISRNSEDSYSVETFGIESGSVGKSVCHVDQINGQSMRIIRQTPMWDGNKWETWKEIYDLTLSGSGDKLVGTVETYKPGTDLSYGKKPCELGRK